MSFQCLEPARPVFRFFSNGWKICAVFPEPWKTPKPELSIADEARRR